MTKIKLISTTLTFNPQAPYEVCMCVCGPVNAFDFWPQCLHCTACPAWSGQSAAFWQSCQSFSNISFDPPLGCQTWWCHWWFNTESSTICPPSWTLCSCVFILQMYFCRYWVTALQCFDMWVTAAVTGCMTKNTNDTLITINKIFYCTSLSCTIIDHTTSHWSALTLNIRHISYVYICCVLTEIFFLLSHLYLFELLDFSVLIWLITIIHYFNMAAFLCSSRRCFNHITVNTITSSW